MNALARCLLAAAVAVVAGCGGQKESGTPTGNQPAATPASTLAATSKFDQGPRAGESPADKSLAEQGEKLFQTKACSACHSFGKRVTCPDLAGVSRRRTAQWMENQILHPDVMVKEDPISHALFAEFALQMPNQGLTPDEAKAVIEYFKHKDQESGHN